MGGMHGMGGYPEGYVIPPIVPDSSYFTHDGYAVLMFAHIVLMTLAWVFVLPIAAVMSITRSTFRFLAQIVFLVLNAAALFPAWIYRTNVPDLYENNVHIKFAYTILAITCIQISIGMLSIWTRQQSKPKYIPIKLDEYRWSQDSGLPVSQPVSPQTAATETPVDEEFEDQPLSEQNHLLGSHPLRNTSAVYTAWSKSRARMESWASSGWFTWVMVMYDMVDRVILILGFIAILTGFVAYGGHFKGHEMFSGLAHFIKGGIFFWYGLLCLGRAMGSFADLGWSWNLKPPASMVGSKKAAVASAEFFESLLIFIYGCINVWLERLGSTDNNWSMGDLEHVAISVMFFGGGLCGMLIESNRVRRLLNSAFVSSTDEVGLQHPLNTQHQPRSYAISTNPMPAIIILLLGMLMSSHEQVSPVSTKMHSLWGMLFFAAALARGVTYLTVWLNPPTSYLPSRPPSEIVVSFCLISGGLLFMASASDIITGMEMYGIHPMVLFTVMMGITAFLMAWEIIVLAVKGWAVRREPGPA